MQYSMKPGTGDDAAMESEYVDGLCTEREIDLTGYIKWWNCNNIRQGPQSETLDRAKHGSSEDESLERTVFYSETHQIPQLSTSHEGNKVESSALSALSILSKSSAYRSLQERAFGVKETLGHSNENENKSNVNKIGNQIEYSSDF